MIAKLLFSHHPLCSFFAEDTVRVGRVHVCIGCISQYPVAIATFGVLLLFDAPHTAALIGAVVAGQVQWLSATGWTINRRRKTWVRVGTGFALGGFVYGLLQFSNWVSVAILAAALLVASLTQYWKVRRLMRTCKRCVYQMDWARCPGFTSRLDDSRLADTTPTMTQDTKRAWRVLPPQQQEPDEPQ